MTVLILENYPSNTGKNWELMPSISCEKLPTIFLHPANFSYIYNKEKTNNQVKLNGKII